MLAGLTGAAACARAGDWGRLGRVTTDHAPPSTAGGDGPGAEEQTAVAIASVQQAAFGDHNIQYQFRTENNGGQVKLWVGSPRASGGLSRGSDRRAGRGSDLAAAGTPEPISLLCRPLQVTYRVVQVTDGQLDGQGDTAGAVSVVSTAAFAGGQQAVTQVGVDGASQRPGPTAASVPPGPAAPFPLVGAHKPWGDGEGTLTLFWESPEGGAGGTLMLPLDHRGERGSDPSSFR